MLLKNNNIEIVVDKKTGYTESIVNPLDSYSMNWVLEESNWGFAEGFVTKEIKTDNNKMTILCTRDNLELNIEKEISETGYLETYSLKNTDTSEFFVTKENFGIHFPYQCNYSPAKDWNGNYFDDIRRYQKDKDFINKTSINHIWCGDDCAYIYSVKLNGKPPYLVMNMIEGSSDDYSISYDVARTSIGAAYRGAIVWHIKDCVILSGETKTIKFKYSFCDTPPQNLVTADKYSAFQNEEITITANSDLTEAEVFCDNTSFKLEKCGNILKGKISFAETGEKKLDILIGNKHTFMYINILPSVTDILQKRARFIAEKQQYHCEGSPLDGAYLIYDEETNNLYCKNKECDHNACNERIGMGVTVCRAINLEYDEKLMESLKKHRAFIEREIFDIDTGMVYNNIGKSSRRIRPYNFPWLACYYLEWFELTGEVQCIINAVNIMFKFFEVTKHKENAQCIEAVRIYNGLKSVNLDNLAERFLEEFLMYVENISNIYHSIEKYGECSWCSELPSNLVSYTSQACILTKDKKYLDLATDSLSLIRAFYGHQPDFHLNCIPVRYWDRYWFGKRPSYGDLFPHYWSALAGWALAWYELATKDSSFSKEMKANLLGNLCVFKENGFASNNYLYPYKITLYSSNPDYKDDYLKPGVSYGKNYDKWANDQDWSIYYASYFVK